MVPKTIKIVLLGDASIGKTSLQITFETGAFPEQAIHVNHSWVPLINVENIEFGIQIWDTGGHDQYDNIRPLSYPHTDVFFLCFSLVSQKSFQSIERKWIKEVQTHCPGTPCILVGLKSDLQKNFEENHQNINDELTDSVKDKIPISEEDIHKMMGKVKAVQYFECSSRKKINVNELFESACKIKIRNQETKNSKCNIS